MNYLDITEIKKHLGTLKRVAEPGQVDNRFELIKLANFEIHITAGYQSLSTPVTHLDNILYYDAVQIAIHEWMRETLSIVCPLGDDRFKNFSWTKYFVYFDIKGISKDSYMGTRVPLEETCQLIREVYKVSRLKMFY